MEEYVDLITYFIIVNINFVISCQFEIQIKLKKYGINKEYTTELERTKVYIQDDLIFEL